MRFIPTRLHGAIDYAWGAALLLAPRRLGLRPGSAAAVSAQAAGGAAIGYAALTDYELGLLPVLSMRQHWRWMSPAARRWPPRPGCWASPASGGRRTWPSGCSPWRQGC